MFSTTSPDQIRKNPLNTSSAKNHWSFGKSPRFKVPNPYCVSSSYQKKTSLSSRRASIGFGNRSKYFDGNKQSVDPGKYQSISDLDIKMKNKKGHSFTCNRDQLNFSNYLKIGENTPSPSTYEQQSKSNNHSNSYSMRLKNDYPKNYFLYSNNEEQRKSREPGPGRYQTVDQFGSKYISSKSSNGGRTSFIGKQRFSKTKKTPGPGDYQVGGIEPDGKCVLSNMRGSGRRAILNEKRELKFQGNKESPGPGSYRQPSDFGHYEQKARPRTARR